MATLESSQSDAKTPNDPGAQLAAVNAAIGNAARNPGGPSASAAPDMGADASIAAVASLIAGPIAGPIVAAGVSILDAMGGGTNNNGTKNNTQNSQFVSWRAAPVQKQTPRRAPLMSRASMGYGEKKQADAAAKASGGRPATGGSVFAAGLADRAMGRGPGLGEKLKLSEAIMAVPPSGANITPEMAVQLRISPALIKERDYAQKIKDNPYGQTGQASTARLKRDLKNGSPDAQKVAQTNPNALPKPGRGRGSSLTAT